jgi:hypothetical protein
MDARGLVRVSRPRTCVRACVHRCMYACIDKTVMAVRIKVCAPTDSRTLWKCKGIHVKARPDEGTAAGGLPRRKGARVLALLKSVNNAHTKKTIMQISGCGSGHEHAGRQRLAASCSTGVQCTSALAQARSGGVTHTHK